MEGKLKYLEKKLVYHIINPASGKAKMSTYVVFSFIATVFHLTSSKRGNSFVKKLSLILSAPQDRTHSQVGL